MSILPDGMVVIEVPDKDYLSFVSKGGRYLAFNLAHLVDLSPEFARGAAAEWLQSMCLSHRGREHGSCYVYFQKIKRWKDKGHPSSATAIAGVTQKHSVVSATYDEIIKLLKEVVDKEEREEYLELAIGISSDMLERAMLERAVLERPVVGLRTNANRVNNPYVYNRDQGLFILNDEINKLYQIYVNRTVPAGNFRGNVSETRTRYSVGLPDHVPPDEVEDSSSSDEEEVEELSPRTRDMVDRLVAKWESENPELISELAIKNEKKGRGRKKERKSKRGKPKSRKKSKSHKKPKSRKKSKSHKKQKKRR